MGVDVIDSEILGEDTPAVVITLDPGEAVVAEAGAMMYLQDGIEMGTALSMKKDAPGLIGKLFEAGKRVLTGDSFFITFFTNNGRGRAGAAFAAPYPGRIVPVELGEFGGELTCQKHSLLRAVRGDNVDIAFTKKIGVGLFGGEGLILQRLSSPSGEGLVFLHAGGLVVE